jgi:predicted ArsR family transcriptional regulator
LLGKDYSEAFFHLLLNYKDISASEAASRLDLHIKTAQDFLETLTALGFMNREEVYEKKRPYYRYRLIQKKISLEIDLSYLEKSATTDDIMELKIREKKNTGVRFTAARRHRAISRVCIWTGSGKNRRERVLNLTMNQGKFLFHLPFPTAEPKRIIDIMELAELGPDAAPEVLNIITELLNQKIIESFNNK